MRPLKFGVIGHQIAYTKSPEILQAIFSSLGISGEFEILDVKPDRFSETMRSLADDGYSGISVTIPYKRQVMEHLGKVDALATAVGAVNSVRVRLEQLTGFNTDVYGFAEGIRQYRDLIEGGRALVLGCGGAAAAAIHALNRELSVEQITVAARSKEKLRLFQTTVSGALPNATITSMGLSEFTSDSSVAGVADGDWNVIVNCTPLGGANFPESSPLPDDFAWPANGVYYDLNYGSHNGIIEQAQFAGLATVDGKRMLVGQAVQSFQLWTGMDVSVDLVCRSVFGDGFR